MRAKDVPSHLAAVIPGTPPPLQVLLLPFLGILDMSGLQFHAPLLFLSLSLKIPVPVGLAFWGTSAKMVVPNFIPNCPTVFFPRLLLT